ncbi:MAG: hypothetical protein ACOC5B_01135 [Myxococcota bacterium]
MLLFFLGAGIGPGVAGADAQPDADVELPFAMPWGDRPPRLEERGERRWLTTAALGRPEEKARRLSVMRETARQSGEQRARDALHRWVDDALARVWARPHVATAAHRVIRQKARVLGVRPLVEGAAVVLMGVPVPSLREAAPVEDVPWAR